MELNSIYSELVLEHSQSGHNKRVLKNPNKREKGHNPSCGDEITLELTYEGNIIKEAGFTGSGCAISQASTSMMIDLLQGKTKEEAMKLIESFISMIQRGRLTAEELEALEDAAALQNISNMPARVKCATLAWHTAKQCLGD